MSSSDNISYSERYYQELREGSRRAALVIGPIVLELVRPRRILDVGCGVGTWLAVFRELGVEDVWGIDGAHVNRAQLEIPVERFIAADLEHSESVRSRVSGLADLVVSLEVAEHLPDAYADAFVDLLVGFGPVVLFSAAIPFQGGLNHLNEQWPDYWALRFRARGYEPIDCLRPRVWQDERVDYWYAQNVLLFVDSAHLAGHPRLKREAAAAAPPLCIVHPKQYLQAADRGPVSVRGALALLRTAIRSAFLRRFSRMGSA